MPYTVFALKWRPSTFDEIIGQGHIVSILKNAIEKNRLAHAYIFAGPRGVGKTSTARILAKALNCKEGPTAIPCQRCPACKDITGGRSLDVIEVDGASNRGIDEIRALRENVKFAPASAKFKVYIIDEVHMLTTEAFNALLKTLEEPPGFVKFIFATTQPHKVIATILSRCQRLDFRRIPVVDIISQLERIVKKESIKIDQEVLFAIARSSDGSLRDAESILDQLTSISEDKVTLKDVISVLGLVEQEALFLITDKIIQKDPKGALGLFNDLIEEGKDISVLLSNLIEHFRNLMVAKITVGDSRLIDLPKEICEKLLEQSKIFSLEEIFNAFNILVNTQDMARRLNSLRIPLEISLVRLAHSKEKTASYTPAQLKPKSIPKPVPLQPQPVKEEVSDPGSSQLISFESIKEAWHKLIGNLERIKMSVATYLNDGRPVKIKENVLTVSFPKNYSLHKESLERKDNKDLVENIMSEIFKAKMKVNFILSKEEAEKDDNKNHPFVQSALELFDGRIIKEG